MSNLLFKKGETPLRYTFAWQYANDNGNAFDIETLTKTEDKKVIILLVEFFDFETSVTIPLDETFIALPEVMGNGAYSLILGKVIQEITKKPEFNVDNQTISKYYKDFTEITDKAIDTCNEIYKKYTGNELS